MKIIDRILLLSVFVTCLFINIFGFDIFNTSRFISLLFFALLCFSVLFITINSKILSSNRSIIYISSLMIFSIILSLFFSGIDVFEGLIGVYGRNIGAITYISLVIMLLSAYFSNSLTESRSLLYMIIVIGTITSLYGLIQQYNLDPLLTNNVYNPVRGFFGNPNFHSAFLGIASIALFSTLLSAEFRIKIKIVSLVLLMLFTFIILMTDSQQGLIVSMFGCTIVAAIKFWSTTRLRPLSLVIVFILPLSVLIIALDLLRKSPWKPFIYEPSVSFRGDFWRAGIAMFLENPLFGVGPDGYRDQFRLYRDEVSVNRIEVDPPINSAHNIFIELAASGGIILLLLFIVLVTLVIFTSIRLIKNSTEYNFSTAGIVGCWAGFFIQSLISVNTIPLSLIGWILMGKILGANKSTDIYLPKKIKYRYLKIAFMPSMSLAIIGIPMLSNDINYKNSLETQNVVKIRDAVYRFPQDVYRMSLVAEAFRRAGMAEIGLQIARDAVRLSPKNYEALEELYFMPNVSEFEKSEILKQLRLLDPLNKKISSDFLNNSLEE